MKSRAPRVSFCVGILLGFLGRIAYAADDPCTVAYRDGTKTTEFNECERAAIAGNAQAEFGYGLILFSGHDRKNDRAAGLDWLTPRQVEDAQKLAAEYLAKYGKGSPLGAGS